MDSADKQQSQVLHMQWGLVKDQMGGFQREMVGMRGDLNALQLNHQKGESGIREMRDGIDGMIQSIEAQVMQNLKQHRMQFDQSLEEQCRRMAEHIGTLEREVREQQRVLHLGFDSEKNERENLHRHFTDRHSEQTSHWQGMQDEMVQAHGALHDRLSKHDEHRSGLQAALAQCDSDIRCELGRVQNDVNGHKSALDSHASSHASALRDLEDKVRAEMFRSQEDQRNGVKGASEMHLKKLEELERKTAAEHKALADETKRGQGAMQSMITGHKDSHHEALQNHLGNLDKELRKEIERRSSQHMEMGDSVHAKLGAHADGVNKFMDEHKRGVDELRTDSQRSKADVQRALDDLQRHLRETQGAHAGHTDAITEVKMLIGEHKVENDRRFDSEKRELTDSLRVLDGGLKKELARLSADLDAKHGGLQDALNGHKSTLDKHVGGIRGDHDSLREQVFANVKDVERTLRKDLGQLGDDHASVHSKLQEQIERAKGDHKATSQAQCEELDVNLRREMQRLQGEHKVAHGKICDMFNDHKTAQERALAAERAARDDHKNVMQGSLSELEKQNQKDLKRLGDDHKSEHSKLWEHFGDHKAGIDKLFAGHRGDAEQHRLALLAELADHRSSTDRQLAGQKSAFDDNHSSLQESQANIERELRKEMERHGENHAGHVSNVQRQMDDAKSDHQRLTQAGLQQLEAEIRAMIQRTSDEHGGKHSALQRMIEALDAQLRGELGGHKRDSQSLFDRLSTEHREKNIVLDQKHASLHVHVQDTFSEHKLLVEKLMGGHVDGLRELVQNERTERFRHHASLQERFDVIETALGNEDAELRERMRLLLEQSGISRNEFDGEVQRIWQALDTHTHIEEVKPQVIEERIIMKQEPVRQVAQQAPRIVMPQARVMAQQPIMREEIVMTQSIPCAAVRSQSFGAMGIRQGSIVQPRMSSAHIQEIDIITTR